MRTMAWAALLAVVLQGVASGQENLRDMPQSVGVVIDPTGGHWQCLSQGTKPSSSVTGLSQEDGCVRVVVASGVQAPMWIRPLHVPFDPQRYPICMVRYRASGIMPSQKGAIRIGVGGPYGYATIARNWDLIADGKVHELMVELRERDVRGDVNALTLFPHMKEPGPGVLELHAIWFESDRENPPVPELPDGEETEFTVRVVDTNGKPVPDATVTVDYERLNGRRSAMTSASGHATVRALTNAQGKHSIHIAKGGMAVMEFTTDEEGEFPETITLLRGARYGGTVVDENGETIPNAEVRIEFRGFSEYMSHFGWHARVLTDVDGRWQTEVLPTEGARATLELWHPDYVYMPVENPPFADLYAGKARFVLPRGCLVQGTVFLPDGRPAIGAWVYRGLAGGAAKRRARVDADGRFEFHDRWIGRTELLAQADGCAPELLPLDVKPGMPDPVLHLKPGNTMRGRVVGPDGAPLADVNVEVSSWRQWSRPLSWHTKTDAVGRFVWRGAPADAVWLQFRKQGHLTTEKKLQATGSAEHEILLAQPVTVTGTITDAATGEPVAAALVVPGLGSREVMGKVAANSLQWLRWAAVRTDRQGRYECRLHMACSYYRLKIEAPDYVSVCTTGLDLGAGNRTIDVQLYMSDSIRGVVYLPDGRPAKGADVYLVPADSHLDLSFPEQAKLSEAFVRTGKDGAYRFPNEPGNWLLVATHRAGYMEATAAVHAQAPDLHLEAWGRIEGVCLIGDGRQHVHAVNALPLSRWTEPGSRQKASPVSHRLLATPDANGRFVIDRVPPGPATVGALVRSGLKGWRRSHTQHVEVKPGEAAKVRIGGTGRPVIGRLVLPEGVPIKAHWEHPGIEIRSARKPDMERPVLPTTWDKLPATERSAQIAAWLGTLAGKAYSKAKVAYSGALRKGRWKMKDRHQFLGTVMPDGTFRVEDVLPGDYVLTYNLMDPGSNPFTGRPLAIGTLLFTVPPTDDARSDTPLDLGKIVLELPAE